MSAGKRMGRNPFERKVPRPAAAPVARSESLRPEEPAPSATATPPDTAPSWERRIDAAHREIHDSSRALRRVERALEWALVDVPADTFMLVLRSFARFRG